MNVHSSQCHGRRSQFEEITGLVAGLVAEDSTVVGGESIFPVNDSVALSRISVDFDDFRYRVDHRHLVVGNGDHKAVISEVSVNVCGRVGDGGHTHTKLGSTKVAG